MRTVFKEVYCTEPGCHSQRAEVMIVNEVTEGEGKARSCYPGAMNRGRQHENRPTEEDQGACAPSNKE